MPARRRPSRSRTAVPTLVDVLWAGRRLVLAVSILGTLVAATWTLLFFPTEYQSRAAILPVERDPSEAGPGPATDLLARLPEALPLAGALEAETREDRAILAFLRSRTLAERLLARPGVLEQRFARPWDALRRALGLLPADSTPLAALAIQEGRFAAAYSVHRGAQQRSPVIELGWLDADPRLAATRLDQVLEELRHYLDTEHETDAGRERRSIEQQLTQAEAELRAWENRLPDQRTPLPTIQREVAGAARLQAELRSRLVTARIAEARHKPEFKVLDRPFVAVRKSWPRWSLILPLAAGASLLAGMLLVCLLAGWRNGMSRDTAEVRQETS